MKKLLLLSALLIFACGSDSADNDSNITQNVLIVNGQEYPISRGVLQLVMGDSGDEVYQNLKDRRSTSLSVASRCKRHQLESTNLRQQ